MSNGAVVRATTNDVKIVRLDLDKLRDIIKKPLRIEFATQYHPSLQVPLVPDFHTVICCSASRLEEGDDDHYVQGAGDDTENWACVLTSEAFWSNKDYLCEDISEEQTRERVMVIMAGERHQTPGRLTPIYPSAESIPFYIGNLEAADQNTIGKFDCVITCDEPEPLVEAQESKDQTAALVLRLSCRTGKLGSRTLRDQLCRVNPFLQTVCARTAAPTILFICSTGKDLSVGVALAVLCAYYNEQGIQSISQKVMTRRLIRMARYFLTKPTHSRHRQRLHPPPLSNHH